MNRGFKLYTCIFDNGVKPCIASVYNFYPTLALLGLLRFTEIPRSHTICWIRDYGTNQTIWTLPELTEKIQKNVSDLRISFFSHEHVRRIKKVKKLARGAKLPVVAYKDQAPVDLKVYTIWWHEGKPHITKSGINENPGAVMNLFERIRVGYVKHYFWESPTTKSKKDKLCSYSSWDEEDSL